MFVGGVKYMAHQGEENDEFEDGTKEPSNLTSAYGSDRRGISHVRTSAGVNVESILIRI